MEWNDFQRCLRGYKRRDGMWKAVAVILFAITAIMSVVAAMEKLKNRKYCEKITEMSKDIPNTKEQEEELRIIKERECAAANSPKNRQTVEERLENDRVSEEA